MEWQISQLFIICPLTFLGGLVDAIGGGGGLISLPAYMIAGFPVHYAIGTNKISSAMGTSITFTKFLLDGYMPLKLSAYGIIFALIGSSLGAKIALLISEHIFKILMLFIVPVTALYVFKSQNLLREEKNSQAITIKTYIICILVAFFLGLYDGFYGPGAGTFMLLLLAGAARLSVQKANGVAKAINFATNVAALAVYLMNGKVILIAGVIAGIFCIAGNYIGARFFEKGGAKTVRPVILVVLALFFIRVIYDLLI
ncbi:MAG: TSUP family transporter [Synergistales bacterium]|nr:TSUP family transporter [Synergistales bacterium]MDY6400786.1 TSUP family transporter [Synergistales bacterium]MDY6403974.1 TSUP family transporter [Synergistales bacterium]MDY6410441.1 TSUP family transporter [Synergistales bacterium]MDY6414579.1 TSUP family transporter [Synergistales bacterium]